MEAFHKENGCAASYDEARGISFPRLESSGSKVAGLLIDGIMKIIQGVVSRADAVVGQAGTLLQNNFPGPVFFVEDIVADAVLPLVGVSAF